jgi:hypothetical protein
MSRLSDDNAVLDEARALLLDRGLAALNSVAAPAAQTSAAVTVTYTTDDPGITANGAQTIADGDAVSIAEQHETVEEIRSQIAALVADTTAIRTALNTAVVSGAGQSTVPAALTSRAVTCAFTYTTDDPAITPNAAVTIADGDLYSAAEIHEAFVEIVTELDLVRDDVERAHNAISDLIRDGVQKAPVLAARTSTNGGVAITYTTDDPSITPNDAVTIADGDLLPAAEALELVEEFVDDLDKLGDDFTALKTAYDLYLVAAGQPTS